MYLSKTKTKFCLEITVDEKKATHIEIAEDAFGDEVYYNYLKLNRKLIDDTDLDEERVYEFDERKMSLDFMCLYFRLFLDKHHKKIC